jgi:hypothetical protein
LHNIQGAAEITPTLYIYCPSNVGVISAAPCIIWISRDRHYRWCEFKDTVTVQLYLNQVESSPIRRNLWRSSHCILHWIAKQFLIFVTQTKVGKQNRNFCAEFKYIISLFFLSGKVFKWSAVGIIGRKPAFMLSDRVCVHYLKSNSEWFFAMFF